MERRVYSVRGNSQRLDGGAMFGNAPKALWQEWAPPDEQNRIDLACRALLIREPSRAILFEAGIGAFFEPKLRARYGVVEERHVLLENLAALGVVPDVIVLSHLHFDHAGGVLAAYEAGQPLRLAFPNASFVVGKIAWERATNPIRGIARASSRNCKPSCKPPDSRSWRRRARCSARSIASISRTDTRRG